MPNDNENWKFHVTLVINCQASLHNLDSTNRKEWFILLRFVNWAVLAEFCNAK